MSFQLNSEFITLSLWISCNINIGKTNDKYIINENNNNLSFKTNIDCVLLTDCARIS